MLTDEVIFKFEKEIRSTIKNEVKMVYVGRFTQEKTPPHSKSAEEEKGIGYYSYDLSDTSPLGLIYSKTRFFTRICKIFDIQRKVGLLNMRL